MNEWVDEKKKFGFFFFLSFVRSFIFALRSDWRPCISLQHRKQWEKTGNDVAVNYSRYVPRLYTYTLTHEQHSYVYEGRACKPLASFPLYLFTLPQSVIGDRRNGESAKTPSCPDSVTHEANKIPDRPSHGKDRKTCCQTMTRYMW